MPTARCRVLQSGLGSAASKHPIPQRLVESRNCGCQMGAHSSESRQDFDDWSRGALGIGAGIHVKSRVTLDSFNGPRPPPTAPKCKPSPAAFSESWRVAYI